MSDPPRPKNLLEAKRIVAAARRRRRRINLIIAAVFVALGVTVALVVWMIQPDDQTGDQNVGTRVPAEHVAAVADCQENANISGFLQRSNPGVTPTISRSQLVIERGTVVRALTRPVESFDFEFKDGAVLWRTNSSTITFCEVKEFVIDPASVQSPPGKANPAFDQRELLGAWTGSGSYKPRFGNWRLIQVIGYDSTLPPGARTELSVSPNGELGVG